MVEIGNSKLIISKHFCYPRVTQIHRMFNSLKSLFGMGKQGVKIFKGMEAPLPNFKIVAKHVRVGQVPKNFVLDDGSKLKSVVEKWQFEPGGTLLRCGYDYQIEFTNGEVTIPISICFACNSLVFNHSQVFKTSKRQILQLLEEDFKTL